MRTRQIAAAGAALAAAAALTLSACGAPADSGSASGDQKTLKVGIIGIGSDAGITLAQQKGFFEKQGITVETTVVANPAAGIAAAQSGQLDITYAPSIPYLNARSQKVPLKVLAAADGYRDNAVAETAKDATAVDDTGLYAGKDSGITRPKDLEGKKVSVPARKAQLEVTIANAVKQDGGDPAKINWMVLDPNSALQSLEQGRVDASGLVAPFTIKAKESGAKFIASPGVEFFEKGAVGLWIAGDSTVQKKSAGVQSFIKAIYEANAYANENYDEAQKVAAEVTKVPLETVKQTAMTYWPTEVRAADLQRASDKLAALGYLPEAVKIDDADVVTAQ
ncbi:MAG: ABC transporter substrate-binding protein [Arthrobacter sp.]|jgi:NitT/TauT family transport system substrate-binding protein|nr:ABC transporter substrate-binding protein [Arthrobacter sp.]